jgi:hypothetical protein
MKRPGKGGFATAVASVLAVIGCTRPRDLAITDVAPPPEVAWYAALAIDAQGAIAASTGLIKRDDTTALRALLPGASGQLQLLGYGADQIQRLIAQPDEDALFASHLTAAASDQPILPDPLWTSGRFSIPDGAQVETAKPLGMELTATWLPACPTVLSSTAVPATDFSCSKTSCAATFSEFECKLTIDGQACGVGDPLTASLGPRGQITFDASTTLGSCTAIQPPTSDEDTTAVLAASCSTGDSNCDLVVHAPPFPVLFDSVSVDLLGPLHMTTPPADNPNPVPPAGHLFGIAILDQAIVAAATDTFRHWYDCDPAASHDRAVFVDPETLQVTAAVRLPPCVSGLVNDPASHGFLATYGGPNGRWLGRFDPTGAQTATVAVAPNLPLTTEQISVLYARGPNVAVGIGPTAGGSSYVAFFDSSTLAPTAVSAAVPGGPLVVIGPGGTGAVTVAGVEGSKDRLLVFDPMSGNFTENDLRGKCNNGGQVATTQLERFTGGDGVIRYVIPSVALGSSRMYVASGDLSTCTPHAPFGMVAKPYSVVVWPPSALRRNLWLLGLTADATSAHPERPASLTLFDALTVSFLPGSMPIGNGQVGPMISDAKGRVWVELPWTASLVRVTPRT